MFFLSRGRSRFCWSRRLYNLENPSLRKGRSKYEYKIKDRALEETYAREKPKSLNFITYIAVLPLNCFLFLEQIKRTLLLKLSTPSICIR